MAEKEETMGERKLNRRLIKKMIKRIETMPESYCQNVYGERIDPEDAKILGRPFPVCGTIACLAGEAVICSERSVKEGIAKLFALTRNWGAVREAAADFTGIESHTGIYRGDSDCWPEPFRSQWLNAKSYKGEARAAINLLKAILRTDGKILEQ